MASIFEELKSNVSDDDLALVVDVQRHIRAEGDETLVCNFVKSAKESLFSYNDQKGCIFEYKDQLYLLLEEKHYNSIINIGFEPETDETIVQGSGMLAISAKHLNIREGISSLEIIECCLGVEPDTGGSIEFQFSELLGLFAPYCVFKIDNGRFPLIYQEDINRLICYVLSSESNSLFSIAAKDRIKSLMLLNSSRSVAGSILNGLSSSLIEYSFLQIYQCLEYLFKLNLSFSLTENHKIPLEKSVDIVLSHEFKIAESENLYSVLRNNVPMAIMESLIDILPVSNSEDSDIYKRMANYIYKLRCNIAHLRYKQEDLPNVNWSGCIDALLEIVFSIYQHRDIDIIQACECKKTWKLLPI